MIKVRRNILVAIHLQPSTCNFLKFKLKMIDIYIALKKSGRSTYIDRRKSLCDGQKVFSNVHHDCHYLDIATTFINFNFFANSSKINFAII